MKPDKSKFVIFAAIILIVCASAAASTPFFYDLSPFNIDSEGYTAENISPARSAAINDYNDYNDRRDIRRTHFYSKYSAELSDLLALEVPHDPEKLSSLLAIIAKVCEYAKPSQKAEIRYSLHTDKAVTRSIAAADQLESSGKFLDAYTQFYKYLTKIYPDNSAYSDKAMNLLLNNEILATLTDSPCEKFAERYEGIKPAMFIKALDIVDKNYVVRITDYRLSALAALDRCILLANVIKHTHPSSYSPGFVKMLTLLREHTALSNDQFSKQQLIDLFEQTLSKSSRFNVVDRAVIIAHFSDGALSALDRHTTIIWPRQISDLEKNMSGNFTGVGVTFAKQNGLWVITAILPDTPAYQSDLQTGDIIHAVDGIPTDAMTAQCMVKYITGSPRSTVTLTVKKPHSENSTDITLKRSPITVPAIQGWARNSSGKWKYMLDADNRIGYIRINSFTKSASNEFKYVLATLEQESIKGLIIDVRNNPGGLVTAAADIVDCFIDKGMIVSLRPRFGMGKYMTAKKNFPGGNYPVAVVVNSSTASAAEIVAGSLQDKKHSRAVVVGSRTFGKGSVQSIIRIAGENARLKYTMARYHLPSGKKVLCEAPENDQWGITPDIEVNLTAEEKSHLASLRNSLSSSDSSDLKDNILAADPQLYTALIAVKATAADTRYTKNR